MSPFDKALRALQAAVRAEVTRELKAAQDESPLQEANRRIRTLESKLRQAKEQRDAHRARCGELRQHLTRYQKEVVELRETLKELPWKKPL